MCIAILSTTHPNYRFIIINNRDEFLARPTSRADWWPAPYDHILSARDLARAAHGTWLGVTKTGRVAVLTNCLETNCARAVGTRSRGDIINSWLTASSEHPAAVEGHVEEFIDELRRAQDLDSVGGFNLLLGDVSEPEPGALAIVSNRRENMECCNGEVQVRRVSGGSGQTVALSNMTLEGEGADHTKAWKKILLGESLTAEAIAASLDKGEGEDALIERLFGVLSTDTLPRLPGEQKAEAYLGVFRESIFIPAIGKASENHQVGEVDWNAKLLDPAFMEGLYGTQTQTVILIDHARRVRYVARTLYDEDGRPLSPAERDRSFEF
ncbi:NRDE protein-domain-containing protein [Aspergillus pseudoustus]|uniref:NRDE protein-domain-containing protein n=1 Tax=Aspergillus pseudoustus TaxID=1810923 RepID=A0ABR4KYA4_9EURO